MALLSNDGPLDTVSATTCLLFSTAWFLAYGLGLEAAKEALPKFLTLFGLLPDEDLFMGGEGKTLIGPSRLPAPWLITKREKCIRFQIWNGG